MKGKRVQEKETKKEVRQEYGMEEEINQEDGMEEEINQEDGMTDEESQGDGMTDEESQEDGMTDEESQERGMKHEGSQEEERKEDDKEVIINNPAFRLGRFMNSDHRIKEEIFTDLCADYLENDHLEMWLMQTPHHVDLKKLQEKDIALNLVEKDSIEMDNDLLSTVAIKYEANAVNAFQILAPGESGELRSVNKRLQGHILITEIPTTRKLQGSISQESIQGIEATDSTSSNGKKRDVIGKRKNRELEIITVISESGKKSHATNLKKPYSRLQYARRETAHQVLHKDCSNSLDVVSPRLEKKSRNNLLSNGKTIGMEKKRKRK